MPCFYCIYAIPALTAYAIYAGGLISVLLVPLFVLGCVPALELLLGKDCEAQDQRSGQHYGEDLLAAYIGIHFVVYACAVVVFCAEDTTSLTRTGILSSFGIMSSFSLIVSHELTHAPEGSWQFRLGQVLHAATCKMHAPFEHNGTHHHQVATKADNGTAARGETLYAFIVRSFVLAHVDAFHERQRELGYAVAVRQAIGWALWPLAVACASALAVGSSRALALFYGQSLVAVPLVAAGNYIAHYGLCQDDVPRQTPKHLLAWNSYHRVSNALLLNLPVHTIHHLFPRRSFPLATPVPDSPTMPLPYAVSAVLAFVPPLWFRLMHPPLDEAIAMLTRRAQKHGRRSSVQSVALDTTSSWAAAPPNLHRSLSGRLSRQLSGIMPPQLQPSKSRSFRADGTNLVRQLSMRSPALAASSAANCMVIDEDGNAISVQLDGFGEGALELDELEDEDGGPAGDDAASNDEPATPRSLCAKKEM